MKRKVEIILQHGWGFDKSSWRGWMPHLRENPDLEIAIQTPDRGYFGEAKDAKPFDSSAAVKIVVVHSLGLHLIEEEILRSADLLVLASSFKQFHNGSITEQRRSRKAIQMMLRRIEDEPLEVLNDFYTNCYHPLLTSHMLLMRNSGTINPDLLIDDLQLLDTNTFDLETISHVPKILLVHGSADEIVDPTHSHQMQEELPNASLVVFDGAGHSLPLTHVAPVWISLRNSLRHLVSINA